MIKSFPIRQGNITLLTVFLTAMIAFLLLLGDNVRALADKTAAQADVTTEQAFFASQSCLEEAYLQLRENPSYTGVADVQVGTATCKVKVMPTQPGATSGQIVSLGQDARTIRTVTSAYTEAGPSITRNQNSILHVLDRSGSMGDNSYCSISGRTDRTSCVTAGGIWHVEPMDTLKTAAKDFVDHLDPAYDAIGLVSFAEFVTVDHALTQTDYLGVKSAIDAMQLRAWTRIGDAVHTATGQLDSAPATTTKIMVVMTDGLPTSPQPYCLYNNGLNSSQCASQAAATAKQNHGILVFTIGLGPNVDSTLLTNMASIIDGQPQYYFAAQPQDLEAVYDEIFRTITAYNIGQGSWNEQ